MELDVVLLRGYEVVGISVTTTNRESELKEKAFEIIYRSKQLGGEEAKAVVNCLVELERLLRWVWPEQSKL